jgi:hypothetical protein
VNEIEAVIELSDVEIGRSQPWSTLAALPETPPT